MWQLVDKSILLSTMQMSEGTIVMLMTFIFSGGKHFTHALHALHAANAANTIGFTRPLISFTIKYFLVTG